MEHAFARNDPASKPPFYGPLPPERAPLTKPPSLDGTLEG